MNCLRDGACSLHTKAGATIARLLKPLRLLPRLLALLVLVIYLPALIVTALLILLTSPGPAVVKKAYRRGKGSREVVYLYEFRTECWRTWQKTQIGTFLHMVDMHRLPRLMNVLQGHVDVGERVEAMHA